MKASELRIGNILYFDIWRHTINGQDILDCECGLWDNKNIKPIPITEEWLFKFGFDPENDLKHPDAPIYFCLVREELICFVHNCSHRHIKYVHELQNIFHAFTGEELTLKTE